MKKACFLLIFLIILSLIPSTKANPDGWVSPSGFADPDSAWSDELKAYDEATATFAVTSNVYQDVWTPYLHLTLGSAIQCNKVRFYISTMALAWEALKISVLKDGGWVEVYNEAFPPPDKWNEVEFSQGSVSEAKVSVKPHGFFGACLGRLNEFDFWEVEAPPVGLKKVLRLNFPLCVALEAMNVAKGDKVLKVNEGVGVVLVAKNALKGDLVFVL